MENINMKKSESNLMLIASVFLLISPLFLLVREINYLFKAYKLLPSLLNTLLYKYLNFMISSSHMILLAVCGIFMAYIIKNIIKDNIVNKLIVSINKVLLYALIVLSGAKIIINIIFGILYSKSLLSIVENSIKLDDQEMSYLILGITDYVLNIIFLVGVTMFCIAILKKYSDNRLKKISLYTCFVGTFGLLTTKLISFIIILPFYINYPEQHEVYGISRGSIQMLTFENILIMLIPLASIIIIKFGIKYSEKINLTISNNIRNESE